MLIYYLESGFTIPEDDKFDQVIVPILKDFPNSGYKKMKGFYYLEDTEYRKTEPGNQ